MGHCWASMPFLTWITIEVLALSHLVWNCIIFVRKGYYKNGKFKFNATFSSHFPQKPPTIHFQSQLFHCLVRESDGAVDIVHLL
jgi:ubiquitin-protein ligase